MHSLHDSLQLADMNSGFELHSPEAAHAPQLPSSSVQSPDAPSSHLKSGCAEGPFTSTLRKKSNLACLRLVANLLKRLDNRLYNGSSGR